MNSDTIAKIIFTLFFAMPLLWLAVLMVHAVMVAITAYDCLKCHRGSARIAWFLAIISLPILGWIYYLCLARRDYEELAPFFDPAKKNKETE